MFGALVLFAAVAAVVVMLWNRLFQPVPWRIAGLLFLACAAYQAETLFTNKVDLPGGLAFHVDPWKTLDAKPARANTGIVFTQLAPWTRVARDQLLSGEVPLWNRTSASGAPLLANQQTAIFHPFTLLGLPLSIGKAFTLSACLRLFVTLFFTFVFLRGWNIRDAAAIFGAIAYTFSTFHVVWLLFPLGLATMMLPVALTGVQELVATKRRAAYALLTAGLSLSVLGGHPESALWVWITTAAYVLYCARTQIRTIAIAASAFIVAMLLTAFFWYPTLRALEVTSRFQQMQSLDAHPADHGLSSEWLLPLVAPNVLGNPVDGTYKPPRGAHPAVLNDYGEVASSYAGLITLALALAAPFVARRRPLGFAIGLMLFALLTIAEAPLWRDALRAVPLAGISLHQRLRVLWDLGVCIAAALSADALLERRDRRAVLVAVLACVSAFAAIYVVRRPAMTTLAIAQLAVPIATALVFAMLRNVRAATLLVFLDLVVATWRYNPPAKPEHVYPVTGAIQFMQSQPKPFRIAAWGWSFLPDTPGFYGLEDVKTTDPMQHHHYMRMLRGYLDIDPASYDLVIRNLERPFADYLNIRFLYVPPDANVTLAGFVERYRGRDGIVLENIEAAPRYMLVREVTVEPDTGRAIFLSKEITDYRTHALVDRLPPELGSAQSLSLAGGDVRIVEYGANKTVLDIESRGWNLLVSSDVHWPGWRAYWNGTRVTPVVVNGAFLGCFIPPGRGRLELRYTLIFGRDSSK